ncbi:MAG: preprotein translocase subunit YajC [Candidatus Symbiobacter sp.]|nr:preprotein translocase subunit YajC [Candidatus Symbiobacter sp.]
MRHFFPSRPYLFALAALVVGLGAIPYQSALAQAAAPEFSFFDPQIMMLVLVFAVFYFIVFRPQQQKAKRHREMLKALKRGDKVLTAGGILGTVVKLVDETEVLVEISPNVQVHIVRSTIAETIQPQIAKSDAANSNETKAAASNNAGGMLSGLAFWRKKD